MPSQAYLELPGVNWSRLRYMLDSARAYVHASENPPSETPAMAFGTAVHLAILEPERVDSELIVAPAEFVTATGLLSTAKPAKEWLATLADDPIVITPQQRKAIDAICRNVSTHRAAADWLARARHREDALTWQQQGIACKASIDAWGDGLLWDLKTWAPRVKFDADAFMREALQRKYLGQLGWYNAGLRAHHNDIREMGWLVVQSAAPYDVAVLELDTDAFDFAIDQAQEAFDWLWLWEKDGKPDRGAHSEVVLCNLPGWMRRDDAADDGSDLEGL